MDLAQLFADALENLRASHAGREIELRVTGDVKGVWDSHRLYQLIGNLVLNALKYGAHDAPVRVLLEGKPTEVEFSVHNRGRHIEPSKLKHIFEPLVRGSNGSDSEGSLGLGLYIAGQFAIAHGGDIKARSDESETVFTVRLPRLTVNLGPDRVSDSVPTDPIREEAPSGSSGANQISVGSAEGGDLSAASASPFSPAP